VKRFAGRSKAAKTRQRNVAKPGAEQARSSSAKLTAFVLMPFSKAFLNVYRRGIKPACEMAKVECSRVDEQIFTQNILQRIQSQIREANVIIAEVTDWNANVYYEVGYAHALGKQVVLLTKSADHIPFDLRHFPHVVYDGNLPLLRAELQKRLVRWLDNPKDLTITPEFPWPNLLRRGMSVLRAAQRKVAEIRATEWQAQIATKLEELARALGARRAHDIQISVIDRDRRFLYHDFDPFVGMAAPRVANDINIYDEIVEQEHGAIAWVDWISNVGPAPAARLNIALFSRMADSDVTVVVECHHEIR
jgi:hypothetical protein